MTKFLGAVLILSGMIIGVGMFGIPYSFARAGFWWGALELAVLTGVILLFHLLYGEIVFKTKESHRLPGYVRAHLGRRAAALSWASAIFGITGTLLAYILVGSTFLTTIFREALPVLGEFSWAVAVTALGALVTLFPVRRGAAINGVLSAALIGFIIFLSLTLLPKVNFSNLARADFENILLPYGVLLFALSGGVVIPDLITALGGERGRARAAIFWGTVIPAALYFLFAFAVVGASGAFVSKEAISGLLPIAGSGAVLAGSIMGFLSVFTSFIVLLMSFQALLRLDYGLPKSGAWLVSFGAPFLLYLLGFQNFILVIGAVGAIAVGIDSALIIAAHYQMRRNEGAKFFPLAYLWRLALYGMMGAGVAYELKSLISNF